MKKILVPLFLVVLLTLAVIPVAAGNGPSYGPGVKPGSPQPAPLGTGDMVTFRQSSPRGMFAMVGTITATDIVARTVTLTVLRSNYLVRDYMNTDVTVLTTLTTKLLYKVTMDSVAQPITFEEILVGDVVSINGLFTEGVFTAQRITKGAALNCLP